MPTRTSAFRLAVALLLCLSTLWTSVGCSRSKPTPPVVAAEVPERRPSTATLPTSASVEKTEPRVADLIKQLSSPDLAVRRAAIRALAERGSDTIEAVDALADLLVDPVFRLEAASALGQIGKPSKRTVPHLYLRLKDTPGGPPVLTKVLSEIDQEAAKLYGREQELRLEIKRWESTVKLLEARLSTARATGAEPATLKALLTEVADTKVMIANTTEEIAAITKSLSYWGEPKLATGAAEPKKTPEPSAPGPSAQDRKRKQLLAALDAKADADRDELEGKYEKNKELARQLRTAEEALVRSPGFGNPGNAKFVATYAAFCEEQAEKVGRVNLDTATLKLEKQEHAQARRRVIVGEPEPEDPMYAEYGGLLLTEKEVGQLKPLQAKFATPKAATDEHVKNLAADGALARPVYAAAWQSSDHTAVVVVSYTISSYRGKPVQSQQVYVWVVKTLGYWSVLELPDQPDSVLLAPPPSKFKRVEEKGKNVDLTNPFDRR